MFQRQLKQLLRTKFCFKLMKAPLEMPSGLFFFNKPIIEEGSKKQAVLADFLDSTVRFREPECRKRGALILQRRDSGSLEGVLQCRR